MVDYAFVNALTAFSVAFPIFADALMTTVDQNGVSGFVDVRRRGRKEKYYRKCEKKR